MYVAVQAVFVRLGRTTAPSTKGSRVGSLCKVCGLRQNAALGVVTLGPSAC